MAALGSTALLGPFATDAYLPAIPSIADDFDVPGSRVQLAIAAFTISQAVGQFLLGAISDRIGRKPVVLGGTLLMTIGAIGAAFAPSIVALIILCGLMGLTVAGGISGGRAVIADLTVGDEATKPFSILAMLLGIGPILGPIVGTVVLLFSGWRGIFVALAVMGALSAILIHLFVPETLPKQLRHSGGVSEALKSAGSVLRSTQFLIYASILWLGFGLMFSWIASSSLIIQGVLGMNPAVNAIVFGVISGVLVVASLITSKLSERYHPIRFIIIGISVQVLAVIALAIVVLTQYYQPWIVLLILLMIGSPMGFVFGPATALAMRDVRFASGTASAVLGSFQFLAAAIATTSLSLLSGDPLVGLLVVGAVTMTLALLALLTTKPTLQA